MLDDPRGRIEKPWCEFEDAQLRDMWMAGLTALWHGLGTASSAVPVGSGLNGVRHRSDDAPCYRVRQMSDSTPLSR